MRAILIDPAAKSVSIIDHPATLDGLRATIDCEKVEAVGLLPGETLWINEEGLLAEHPGPFFQIAAATPMAGRGVVLGSDDRGETVASRLAVDFLFSALDFPDIELIGWRNLDGIVETAFGPMPMVGTEPIFQPCAPEQEDR